MVMRRAEKDGRVRICKDWDRERISAMRDKMVGKYGYGRVVR